jgi:hypothetical protein
MSESNKPRDYSAIDALKRAETIIRMLHDTLDEIQALAADPQDEPEDKLGMILDCVKEGRERALWGDKRPDPSSSDPW